MLNTVNRKRPEFCTRDLNLLVRGKLYLAVHPS